MLKSFIQCTYVELQLCRKKNCKVDIMPLHSKNLPVEFSQISTWLCTRCEYITCVQRKPDGTLCGKEMPRWKQKKVSPQTVTPYVCGECANEAAFRDERKAMLSGTGSKMH